MPRRPIRFEGRPLLDIATYARRGPGRRDGLSPAEIELIARTVRRTPEVMVKVLTRGGQDIGAVRKHFEYLNRKGELEIETDDRRRLGGKGVERELTDDWDLDIEEDRRRSTLDALPARSPPKLVHKVLFSKPPGTPPQKVLEAVKIFAREEFGLKHRYAMVLHTDEPHPHVHMVIKALSEQGKRLNIRKASLRGWRAEFARHLRELGVPANATERAVRGNDRSPKRDAIYRAAQPGESKCALDRVLESDQEDRCGTRARERGRATIARTRKQVRDGWNAVCELLNDDKQVTLATLVRQFATSLEPPQADGEQMTLKRQDAAASPLAQERTIPR